MSVHTELKSEGSSQLLVIYIYLYVAGENRLACVL